MFKQPGSRSYSIVWNYFDKLDLFRAKCKICDQDLSYFSTTHNLRTHLIRKHQTNADEVDLDNIEEVISEKKASVSGGNSKNYTIHESVRPHKSWVWQVYKKKSLGVATCSICGDDLRYLSTTANLSSHVRRKHAAVFEQFKGEKREESGDEDISFIYQGDEDSNSSLQEQDVYFEECDGQISCNVCKKNISDDGEDPRGHLEEHHPGLLARIIKNEEKSEETNNQEDAEKDIFTEVVYLDHITDTKSTPKRVKYIEKSPLIPKKRKLSTSDLDFSSKIKKIEEKYENPSELESFLSYIRILLKKLPSDVCSKVQLDIINLIMTAQFQLSNTSIGASNTSQSNVANVSIVLDTAQNS